MAEPDIIYAVEDGVATIRFNRPQTRNAFGDTTRADLLKLLRKAHADHAIGCIVITGTGKAFAAGGDINSMQAQQSANDARVVCARIEVARQVVRLIREIDKPVIAAINGAAAGGGLNLALACDIRYCATSAIFSESFVKFGVVPDWGGHYSLPRLVGTSRAMELMMLGERFDADAALRFGLVNAIYPDACFAERVAEKARAFAAGPREAIAMIKRGVLAGSNGSLEETLDFELSAQRKLFLSDDAREGINAFVEKRAPVFGAKD